MVDFISIDGIRNIIISCNIDINLFEETKYGLEFRHKHSVIYLNTNGLVEYNNNFHYYDEENDFELFKIIFDKLKNRMIEYDYSYGGYLHHGTLLESQVNMLILENEKLKQEII